MTKIDGDELEKIRAKAELDGDTRLHAMASELQCLRNLVRYLYGRARDLETAEEEDFEHAVPFEDDFIAGWWR